MKDNGILRRILLAILLCLLILPYTQEKLLLFKETPLNGAITTVDKPLFSVSEWQAGHSGGVSSQNHGSGSQ